MYRLDILTGSVERCIQLCDVISQVNGIKRIAEVRHLLLETRDFVQLFHSLEPDDLLSRASESLLALIVSAERTLTKASQSKVLSNVLFKKRIKDLIYNLSLENQRLVRYTLFCFLPADLPILFFSSLLR